MKVEFDIQEKPKSEFTGRKGGSSLDIYELAEVQAIKNAVQEHLIFIGMDNANNIRDIKLLGIGTNNNVTIDSKEIIRTALMSASDKVVLVHNHPSNSLLPSKHDMYISNKTSKMLKCFNIRLVDHIIVTEKDYHSMGKEINYEFSNTELAFMDNTFLQEENQKLKNEIKNLKEKIKSKNKNKDNFL